jgi:hypothetical protein
MRHHVHDSLHRDIDACVRDLREEMIAFTSELVAIASENPPGSNYRECVRAIASRLRELGLPATVSPFALEEGSPMTPAPPLSSVPSAPVRVPSISPVTTMSSPSPRQASAHQYFGARRCSGVGPAT